MPTLLEHAYAVLYDDADVAQFVQVGLLCMAYFAVAWLAHTLAKYAVDSQLLAQRRGRDLVSLSEANRLVMRDMQDGVLVVDGEGVILQMNTRAEQLLRKSISPDSSLVGSLSRSCSGSMRCGNRPEARAAIPCSWMWGCRPGCDLLLSSAMRKMAR